MGRPHRSDKDRVSTYRTLQGKVKTNQAVFQDLIAPRQVWSDVLTPRWAGTEASRGRQAPADGERPGHCQSMDLWCQKTGPFNFVGRYRRKHIQTPEEESKIQQEKNRTRENNSVPGLATTPSPP